jgi:hypothetical protein
MKFLKKNNYGFDFILTNHFKLFTDCKEWFCYIALFQYTIRFSSAGFYIYNKKKESFIC